MDHIKHARSMMNYTNRLATLLMTKHKFGSPEFIEALQTRWQPKMDQAEAYCREHGIIGRYL
jgi:hypothetical protein